MDDSSLPLLRTRGGISSSGLVPDRRRRSSPHTRRYFLESKPGGTDGLLFSAHAEVFPQLPRLRPAKSSLLRTRGGISISHSEEGVTMSSSPHTRRYFPVLEISIRTTDLFSAHAEVFPWLWFTGRRRTPLLRTRGGISCAGGCGPTRRRSSPHTRRYFLVHPLQHSPSQLFSAHAEVFPNNQEIAIPEGTLLRTRGGISGLARRVNPETGSSPHTRRYFHCSVEETCRGGLFSAHAEVFPAPASLTQATRALLRTRGGISTQ